MRELKLFPPNFREIVKVFPQARNPGVIFAFGDTIYNPTGAKLTRELIQHEEIHGCRQFQMGIENWWDTYLQDIPFRFNEELMAHRVEWQWHSQLYGHDEKYLRAISERLAGPLYGRICGIADARRLITNDE